MWNKFLSYFSRKGLYYISFSIEGNRPLDMDYDMSFNGILPIVVLQEFKYKIEKITNNGLLIIGVVYDEFRNITYIQFGCELREFPIMTNSIYVRQWVKLDVKNYKEEQSNEL